MSHEQSSTTTNRAKKNAIATESDVAWPPSDPPPAFAEEDFTVANRIRCESTMAVECAGTRSERVSGEILEEKRKNKHSNHRIGNAFSIKSIAENACDEG